MLKEKILNWIGPFINLPLVGLDVSDQSIKYCSLQKTAVAIDSFGTLDIPNGVIIDGVIQKEEEFTKILRRLTVHGGRKIPPYVIISLPEEKSFLRLIQLPKVERQTIQGAVRWEIEGNVPLPLEDVFYDYEVIEPLKDGLNHYDVVITAIPKEIVESYIRTFKEAFMQPVVLELESQAIVRAAIKNQREKTARILTHVGRNTTSLVIVAGGAILYTSTLKLGGATFEENITRAVGVTPTQAVAIKKEHGLDKQVYEGRVFSALILTVSALADELKRAVGYYQNYAKHTHGANTTIDEILLVGGDASLFGLPTFLSSTLRIPVRLGDPFSTFPSTGNGIWPIPQHEALAYITAIGLALRGVRGT